MHAEDSPDQPPLADVDELVELFRTWAKPRADWRVGNESEMIGVYASGERIGQAPPYEGPQGIGELLARIAKSGWTPIREGDTVIALASGEAQITLEPGGQLELAARPVDTSAELDADLCEYERVVADVSRDLDLAWLAIGFRPFGRLEDVPWMPKGRYDVMREYLPTRGALAHEMMKRTSTIQVNIDYGDADDAGAKLRCAMSVTSILTAMFANSPIVDGALTDYQSYRARVWRDTDPDRCGLLPLAFEDGDVFRKYVDFALDVPMFFVQRDGYIAAEGMTFRRFLAEGFRGERATLSDWELHLSTLFPEARLKRFLEIRGCDSGARDMVLALGPLCRGLLYDDTARADATGLTAGMSFDQRLALADDVARDGLAARVGDTGHTAGDLARDLLALAADGLSRVAPADEPYLAPLREIVETGRTRADRAADVWRATGGDPAAAISSFRRFA